MNRIGAFCLHCQWPSLRSSNSPGNRRSHAAKLELDIRIIRGQDPGKGLVLVQPQALDGSLLYVALCLYQVLQNRHPGGHSELTWPLESGLRTLSRARYPLNNPSSLRQLRPHSPVGHNCSSRALVRGPSCTTTSCTSAFPCEAHISIGRATELLSELRSAQSRSTASNLVPDLAFHGPHGTPTPIGLRPAELKTSVHPRNDTKLRKSTAAEPAHRALAPTPGRQPL